MRGWEGRSWWESGSRRVEALIHAILTWLPICASQYKPWADPQWLERANQRDSPIHTHSQPTHTGWLGPPRRLTKCPRCRPKPYDWMITPLNIQFSLVSGKNIMGSSDYIAACCANLGSAPCSLPNLGPRLYQILSLSVSSCQPHILYLWWKGNSDTLESRGRCLRSDEIKLCKFYLEIAVRDCTWLLNMVTVSNEI